MLYLKTTAGGQSVVISPVIIFQTPLPELRGVSRADQQRYAQELYVQEKLEGMPDMQKQKLQIHEPGKKLIAKAAEYHELSAELLCAEITMAHRKLQGYTDINSRNAETIFNSSRQASLAAQIALIKGQPGLEEFRKFKGRLSLLQQDQSLRSLKLLAENEVYHGADSLAHGCRLGLLGPAFLDFYNRCLSQTSFNAMLRNRVQKNLDRVRAAYGPFMPNKKINGLEDIIAINTTTRKGPFVEVSSVRIQDMSIAFNLHDVMKFENLELFESMGGIDSAVKVAAVREHILGLNKVLNTWGPVRKVDEARMQEIKFTIANHHCNYGNGKDAYGLQLDLQGLFLIRNPRHVFSSVLSFDLKDVARYTAADYFMNKVLDLLDKLDALWENRSYKAGKPLEEALSIIKREFLVTVKPIDRLTIKSLFGEKDHTWEHFFVNAEDAQLYFRPGIRSVMQRMILDSKLCQKMIALHNEYAGLSVDPLIFDLLIDFLTEFTHKKKDELNQFKYMPD